MNTDLGNSAVPAESPWRWGGWSRWLVAACVLAAAAALRVAPMTQSLWYDEACRTFQVLDDERGWHVIIHDVHNPLYNALMYGWIRVFGDGEVSIRVPSLIAGFGLAGLMWAYARRRWGAWVAARATAWLVLSPVHVWYSCEAKNNIFTAFFAFLAFVAIDTALRQRTARAIAAAAVAGRLALWTDWQTLFTLVPVCVTAGFMLWRWRPDREEWPAAEPGRGRRYLLLGIIITGALLLTSPLIALKLGEIEKLARDYPRYFHLHRGLWILAVYFPTGNALTPHFKNLWLAGAVVLSPIYVVPMALGVRRIWRGRTGGLVVAASLAPLLLMWIGSEVLVLSGARTRIYQERNLIVMLPFVAMVLFIGVNSLPRFRGAMAGLCIGISALSSAFMYTLHHSEHYGTVMAPNPDWRGLAAAMDAARAPGKAVVVSRTPLLPLRYYAPWADTRSVGHKAAPVDEVRKALKGPHPGEVWLVECKWWAGLGSKERLEVYQQCQVVKYIERFGVRAYLIKPAEVVDGVAADPSYPVTGP